MDGRTDAVLSSLTPESDRAAAAGVFEDEITPITLKIKKKEVEMKLDEHPKPKTTLEQLAKLPPVFKKGGVVTAGGASG